MSDLATLNEDWVKTGTWDLRNPDGTLVMTPEQLEAAVGDVTHFLTLPAAASMPESLRAAYGTFWGLKHGGPGPHTTGSPQLVHAGRGRALTDQFGTRAVFMGAIADSLKFVAPETDASEVLDLYREFKASDNAFAPHAPSVADVEAAIDGLDEKMRTYMDLDRRQLRDDPWFGIVPQPVDEIFWHNARIRGERDIMSLDGSLAIKQRTGSALQDWGVALARFDEKYAELRREAGVGDDYAPPASWRDIWVRALDYPADRLIERGFLDDVPSMPARVKMHVQDRIAERLLADNRVTDDAMLGVYEHVNRAGGPTPAALRQLLETGRFVSHDEFDVDDDLEPLDPQVLATNSRGWLQLVDERYAEIDSNLRAVYTTPDEVRTAIARDVASKLVGKWAATSNDHDPLSLAIQEAAVDEFELTDYARWDELGFASEPLMANVATIKQRHGDVLRAFVRAQHDETQRMFKAGGVDTVRLYRGFKFRDDVPDWWYADEPVTPELRPLSSFSTSRDVAFNFGDYVVEVDVPVDQILATPTTGVGCLGEEECVVIASRALQAREVVKRRA